MMKLTWDREHNIADIAIVEGDLTGRGHVCWEASEDLVFDLDENGAVLSIEVLDPARLLAGVTTPEEALSRVLGSLATLRAS